VGATPGMPPSASKSNRAPCLSRSSPCTPAPGSGGYFRLEWKLAVDRSHLMAAEKPFLVPVVIDDTGENDARVPDRFHEIQWTRLPNGEAGPDFVSRIGRLLGPVEPGIGSSTSTHAAPVASAPPPRSHVKWPLLAMTALLLSALAYIAITHPAPPAIPDKSIAALPFTDLARVLSSQAGASRSSNSGGTSSPLRPVNGFNPDSKRSRAAGCERAASIAQLSSYAFTS
jgi:hypothetical protein